jgi:hypothetical protein
MRQSRTPQRRTQSTIPTGATHTFTKMHHTNSLRHRIHGALPVGGLGLGQLHLAVMIREYQRSPSDRLRRLVVYRQKIFLNLLPYQAAP